MPARSQEAADVYASLIQKYPTAGAVPEALYRLGYAQFVLGDYPGALATLGLHPRARRPLRRSRWRRICCCPRFSPPRRQDAPADPRRAAAYQNAIAAVRRLRAKVPAQPERGIGHLRPRRRRFPDQDYDGGRQGLRNNLKRFPGSATYPG